MPQGRDYLPGKCEVLVQTPVLPKNNNKKIKMPFIIVLSLTSYLHVNLKTYVTIWFSKSYETFPRKTKGHQNK
jgi:uncharacterized membrane protein YoaT (DUF817 family)